MLLEPPYYFGNYYQDNTGFVYLLRCNEEEGIIWDPIGPPG